MKPWKQSFVPYPYDYYYNYGSDYYNYGSNYPYAGIVHIIKKNSKEN